MSNPTGWVVVDAEFRDRIIRHRAMDQQTNHEMIGQWVASALHDGATRVTTVRTATPDKP